MSSDADTSVQVALRIRPQNAREQIDMCRMCTFCTPEIPQIILGKDKAFTYDFVYDTMTEQESLYCSCVEKLVEGCFDGYNATVLAYGQTGSGKTYTMGTGFEMHFTPEEQGVVPRAVNQIFSTIAESRRSALESGQPPPQFEVTAEFLELYNEDIIDLFDESARKLRIHEDPSTNNIYVAGATELKIESEEETLACLKRGALSRSVGSTNMNAQSSRSHAIFTLHLLQQRACRGAKSSTGSDAGTEGAGQGAEPDDWETLRAKFHFVDLAGSERLKRTGATGERAKEGISINCGLLALGNVISALGDKAKRGCHVPYRDSKLTRLLQDSLGGNSRTLMIACISPTDRDFMETLNSLKYANRARNIKNKVTVNQDKGSQQLAGLRARIQELEVELQEFRSGRMVVSEDGSVVVNDMAIEITMLRTENDKYRVRLKALQAVIDQQSSRLAALSAEREAAALCHQDQSTGQVVSEEVGADERERQFSTVIQGYMEQIEELKSRLVMSESMAHQAPRSPFRRAPSTLHTSTAHPSLSHRVGGGGGGGGGRGEGLGGSTSTVPFDQATEDLLELTRTNIQKLREQEERKTSSSDQGSPAHQRRAETSKRKAKRHSDPSEEGEGPGGASSAHQHPEFGSDDDSSNEYSSEGSGDDSDSALLRPGDSDSDEEDSDDDDNASLASSIAELSSEINLKQQLVAQLEKAQRSLYTMKQQYEDKMTLLQHQIKSIESERDKVLKDIVSQRSGAERGREGTVKDVKAGYEKQLSSLRSELKNLKTARKEHARALKKNAQHERELKQLKSDLLDMKKQRVKMLTKMRSDAAQRKSDDTRRTREVAQLRKEQRKHEHKIKSLEADKKQREAVLKRRQEELSALRRTQRTARPGTSSSSGALASTSSVAPLLGDHSLVALPPTATITTSAGYSFVAPSAPISGRQPVTHGGGGRFDRFSKKRVSSVFTSDSARKKWRRLERKITNAVLKRQTISTLAKDMDHWIEQRDQLSRKMEGLRKQRQTAEQNKTSLSEPTLLSSLDEDLDSTTAHIDYVQENIVELQNELIVMDDTKTDGDTLEAHTIITSCSPREAKYLLEHLLDTVLSLGVKAEQKNAEVRSLQARLKASEESAEIIKSMSSPQVSYPVLPNPRTVTKTTRLRGASEAPPLPSLDLNAADSAPPSRTGSGRGRPGSGHGRSDSDDSKHSSDSSSDSLSQVVDKAASKPSSSSRTQAVTTRPKNWRRRTALPSEISSTSSSSSTSSTSSASSRTRHKSDQQTPTRQTSEQAVSSGRQEPADTTDGDAGPLRRSTGGGAEGRSKALKKRSQTSGSLEPPPPSSSSSCPGSPGSSLKGLVGGGGPGGLRSGVSESNVWARLQANSRPHDSSSSSDLSRGSLERHDHRKSGTKLLHCTHTASGHSASVLSVCATQNYLFSASQDRTVKVWNLRTGSELLTLDKHFSYVRCVRFSPRTHLIFTASQSLIKIWDMRHHKGRCIRTFGPPSGSVGVAPVGVASSSATSSETVVQDLLVDPSGDILYSASGNIVNIWDLRTFSHCGRLVGHNGAVCALTQKGNVMVTGSRDRLIKLYDLEAAAGGTTNSSQASMCTLYPPHYDAVSSFGIYGDLLFSSCGVTIKQWDLKERSLKQAVDGAHSQGNTISSLATLSSPLLPLLVSGCKGGLLKLWNPDSCSNIGEMVAHKHAINSIATNDTCVFTGSSDKTIRVWRPNPFQDS